MEINLQTVTHVLLVDLVPKKARSCWPLKKHSDLWTSLAYSVKDVLISRISTAVPISSLYF